MNIEKYTSYFHDGDITKISHKGQEIEIYMESAELLPDWNEDNIPLSKGKTIAGKLHLERIKTIRKDNTPYSDRFKIEPNYDKAGIYDFEINLNVVTLLIWWIKHPPNAEDSDIFKYEIVADKIFWENIPTLVNPFWESIAD